MLNRFPGRSRQKWYDPEDAFSETITETYEEALKGDLKVPPEKDDWHGFLHECMRKKLWLQKRRDSRNLTAEAGRESLLQVEASDKDDPVLRAETRNELELMVPKVKEMLSPKEQAVFFADAQDLPQKEVARVAGTTPGAARVHLSHAEEKLDKKLRRKKKKVA